MAMGSGTARGIKAGNAFITLGLKDMTGQALNAVGKRFSSFSKRLQSMMPTGKSLLQGFGIGAGIAVGMGAIKALTAALQGLSQTMWRSVNMAGDLEESMNVFDVAFGKSARAVEDWARTYGDSIGRSRKFMIDTTASFRYFAGQLGYTGEEADRMAKSLTALSIDLGSFWNLADSDVAWRLRSALQGNYEAVRLLNINLSDKTIQEYAKRMGMVAKDLTLVQKRAIAYNIVVDATKSLHGDAAKTATSWANQMKILQSRVEDIALALGEALMPYMKGTLGMFTRLAKVVKTNAPVILSWLGSAFMGAGKMAQEAVKWLADTVLWFFDKVLLTGARWAAKGFVVIMQKAFQTVGKLMVTSWTTLSKAAARFLDPLLAYMKFVMENLSRMNYAMLNFKGGKMWADMAEMINTDFGKDLSASMLEWGKEIEGMIDDETVAGWTAAIDKAFAGISGGIERVRKDIRRSGLGEALYNALWKSLPPEGRRALAYIIGGRDPRARAARISKAPIPGTGGGTSDTESPSASAKAVRAATAPSTMFRSTAGIQQRIHDLQQKMLAANIAIARHARETAKSTREMADSLEAV